MALLKRATNAQVRLLAVAVEHNTPSDTQPTKVSHTRHAARHGQNNTHPEDVGKSTRFPPAGAPAFFLSPPVEVYASSPTLMNVPSEIAYLGTWRPAITLQNHAWCVSAGLGTVRAGVWTYYDIVRRQMDDLEENWARQLPGREVRLIEISNRDARLAITS